jgi:hypothetical protein
VSKTGPDIEAHTKQNTLTLQKPESFRVKASKGEVVVFYFEPLATQDLKFSGMKQCHEKEVSQI